jgi:hypothetical protein
MLTHPYHGVVSASLLVQHHKHGRELLCQGR